MSYGQILYRDIKIMLALFTRPEDHRDCMVLSIPLFYVPATGNAGLFRQLLSWNNGATETVHFSIDEPLNTLNVVCLRPIVGMDFREFQYCIDSMISVAKSAPPQLQEKFGLSKPA